MAEPLKKSNSDKEAVKQQTKADAKAEYTATTSSTKREAAKPKQPKVDTRSVDKKEVEKAEQTGGDAPDTTTKKSDAELLEEKTREAYLQRKAEQEAEERLATESRGKTLEEYRADRALVEGDWFYNRYKRKRPGLAEVYAEAKIKAYNSTYNFLCKIFGDPRKKDGTKPAEKEVGITKATVQPLNGKMKEVATGVSRAIKNGVQPKASPTGPKPQAPSASMGAKASNTATSSKPTASAPKVAAPKMGMGGGGLK